MFKEKPYKMPEVLKAKFDKYLLLSGAVAILGILTCCVLFSGFSILKTALFPVAIAIFLALDGLYFKYKVVTYGYDVIEGVCIDHKYSNIGTKLIDADLSLRKQVIGLLVECEKEIINIPVPKNNDVAPIGNKIKAYIPKDAIKRINHNGVTIFSSIYGYEIIPDTDISEEKQAEITEK